MSSSNPLPKSASKYSVESADFPPSTTDSKADLADEGEDVDRGKWGSKAEFILSCVGLSVGLGNIWRFPFLAYENGGGAFVIPYIILLILAGKPMYFMELLLGQYSSLGPTAVWRCAPIGRGIGLAMCFVSLIVAIYYNVIMAYTLYYFFGSMQGTMPWTVCSSLGGVVYQGSSTGLPEYKWINGSDLLNIGPDKDPIQCMELGGDKAQANYAVVKENKYFLRYRTILKAEREWMKDRGLTFSATTDKSVADDRRKKFLEFVNENEDDDDLKGVEDAVARIPFCTPDFYENQNPNCANDTCYLQCRCSGNSTNDAKGCKCDIGLSVCDKTAAGVVDPDKLSVIDIRSSTELYFQYIVLEHSEDYDFGNLGTPRWKIVLCLLFSWIVVFVCLFKGVKSSGKVVYFTATFPYLILIILLIKGCTMEGAGKGIEFFLKPTWDKMSQVVTWRRAAGQMFFSLSVSWGGLIMFGSYNQFRNRVHFDAMLVSILDTVTSILGGITIFSVLGNMATQLDTEVDEVAGNGGFGLAFVVYPQALASLPPPQFWTIIFFFMLFTLGLDSEFALLETVITGFSDEWPRIFRRNKAIVCGVMAASCFLLALPCTCQAGSLVTDMLDTYGGGFVVLFIAFTECMTLMWVYGFWNFSKDCKLMLGFEPSVYWIFTWSIAAPVLLLFLFIYSLADYTPIEGLPAWGDGIGWIFAAIIMATIAFYPVIQLGWGLKTGRYGNMREGLWRAVRPMPNWGPADKSLQLTRYTDPEYSDHWSWLPSCVKDKESQIKKEIGLEMKARGGAKVNQAYEP